MHWCAILEYILTFVCTSIIRLIRILNLESFEVWREELFCFNQKYQSLIKILVKNTEKLQIDHIYDSRIFSHCGIL